MLRSAAAKEKMSAPATASAVMHASVLAAVFFGLPSLFNKTPPLEPEPVMIEFEAIDKKAAAPTVGNPPPQPKDAPIAEDTTKAPPPKTAEPPPAPEPPPKPPEQVAVAPPPPPPAPPEVKKPDPPKQPDEVALKPKTPEPPKVEKQPDVPKPPPPPEVKKPDPPKPPPPTPKPQPKTADSLVDDILKNKNSPNTVRTPEQQPKPPQQVTRQPTAAPQLAAVVTASEIEGVRAKIKQCWHTLGAAKESPVVTFTVQMQPDGRPSKVEVRDTGRYNNDPVFRAAADSAWRALMNPRCQPWPLPPDKYANGWRYITFNFDPSDY